MRLKERLAEIIGAEGPITVARYMDLCLHDPDAGYYSTRPRLGPAGDFITAPHVSQMFGELLGLWASEVFVGLGRPPVIRLIELGPGDGTMMTDVLRAISRATPSFLEACKVVLVETSDPLRAAQARALAGRAPRPLWVESAADIPDDAPVIVLANEFLDCLPIEQAVKTSAGWRRRRVGLDDAGELRYVLESKPSPACDGLPAQPSAGAAPVGAVMEWSPAAQAFASVIGSLVASATGAALFLDYAGEGGDSLQALSGHVRESALARPGEADLTAHVGFEAFIAAARAVGADATPVRTQGDFLRSLGIEARASALALAHPSQAGKIGRQLGRLIDDDQMGTLFKAACAHSPGLLAPGFGPAG